MDLDKLRLHRSLYVAKAERILLSVIVIDRDHFRQIIYAEASLTL